MTASPAPTKRHSRGRIAVVSGLAHNPMAPRGQRTQNLIAALSENWEVEVVALPAETFANQGTPVARQPLWRRALGSVLYSVAIDRWEPWASRRLRRWRPDVDAALLVGYPWSPVTRAARRLARLGIPYVVDAGDPWVLTEMVPQPRTIATWRSRRAERPLWRGAAGAVVTTRRQGERLGQLFPELRILVRPNGYAPAPGVASTPSRREREPGSLRLAHFGSLSSIRVDVGPLLAELQESGRWSEIAFAQFGDDYVGMLKRVPKGVRVERHPARPWTEIVARAGEFDAAAVLGNQLGYLLPSKAIQYLTLPIPRLAVTGGEPDDALAGFAEEHAGWLVATPGEPELARRVWEHLGRSWSTQELAPPRAESWSSVAAQVSAFIAQCVRVEAGAERTVSLGESAPVAGGSA